jgi:hypothetical protein
VGQFNLNARVVLPAPTGPLGWAILLQAATLLGTVDVLGRAAPQDQTTDLLVNVYG